MAEHVGHAATETASGRVPFVAHPDEIAKVIGTAADAGGVKAGR